MGHEHDEFAEFYQASRDSCLRAVTAIVGDRALAEEQVAEAFARAWTSWGKVRRHAAPRAWVVRTASCFSTPGQPGQPAIHITGTPTQG